MAASFGVSPFFLYSYFLSSTINFALVKIKYKRNDYRLTINLWLLLLV